MHSLSLLNGTPRMHTILSQTKPLSLTESRYAWNVTSSRSENTEPVSTVLYASGILALPSLLTPISPHLLSSRKSCNSVVVTKNSDVNLKISAYCLEMKLSHDPASPPLVCRFVVGLSVGCSYRSTCCLKSRDNYAQMNYCSACSRIPPWSTYFKNSFHK